MLMTIWMMMYLSIKCIQKGKILISAVGVIMFGSIMNTFNPGTKISKGQEMGYFAFGGSTIVMLVDKNLKNRSGYY